MAAQVNAVAFFDIGETLASVRVAPSGDRIEELLVFPDMLPSLEMLRSAHVRLGILSNRGAIPEADVMDALAHVGLLPLFERDLILFGAKDSPLLFEQAAARVAVFLETDEEQPTLLFVGEDAIERSYASKADFLVAPHPRLALPALLHQGAFRFLRICVSTGPNSFVWREELRKLALVPLHLSFDPEDAHRGAVVYAIADTTTALKLDDLGFWVDRLGVDDAPLLADLYILRDDQQEDSGFLAPIGSAFTLFRGMPSASRVLTSTHEGLFVSIPAGRSIESYHFPGTRHGHNLKLSPTMVLLEPTQPEENERLIDTLAVDLSVPGTGITDGVTAMMLNKGEKNILKAMIRSHWINRDVRRYAGAQPAAAAMTILSRHIHHTGNTNAVRLLCDDLNRMGANALHVRTHCFMHEGRSYQNVEATLPASDLPGTVLLTAHLDSTGARQEGYRASVDPAPGADDDASGIAGVLAAARAILRMDAALHVPRREIRFVLFNAEEHGLVGSRAYANEQARLGTKIAAVFQMDMIGYDVNPTRAFELHAGFTPDASVQQRSARLAAVIAALVPQVSSGLPAPQIYDGAGQPDPAERRSDHYSFQIVGYAACLASEDFFAGPGPGAPMPEPNPNYHLPADNTVNARYTADIARAVAGAAWFVATR